MSRVAPTYSASSSSVPGGSKAKPQAAAGVVVVGVLLPGSVGGGVCGEVDAGAAFLARRFMVNEAAAPDAKGQTEGGGGRCSVGG